MLIFRGVYDSNFFPPKKCEWLHSSPKRIWRIFLRLLLFFFFWGGGGVVREYYIWLNMFVAIQMFDDELREFWNWPKDDLQIKLGKPYAQDYSTEIIGGRRLVFHDQLWFTSGYVWSFYEICLWAHLDARTWLHISRIPTKSHRVNRVTSTLAGEAKVQTVWCQHHHVNFTLWRVLIILRQLGWLEKTRFPFSNTLQYGFDNPTTKGGGVFCLRIGRFSKSVTPPNPFWKSTNRIYAHQASVANKRFKRDSPTGDCYWMGGISNISNGWSG